MFDALDAHDLDAVADYLHNEFMYFIHYEKKKIGCKICKTRSILKKVFLRQTDEYCVKQKIVTQLNVLQTSMVRNRELLLWPLSKTTNCIAQCHKECQ